LRSYGIKQQVDEMLRLCESAKPRSDDIVQRTETEGVMSDKKRTFLEEFFQLCYQLDSQLGFGGVMFQ